MSDHIDDNLDSEEFELDDLEGGISSLSSIFSDHSSHQQDINLDISSDEAAVSLPEQVPGPEPEDDDISPPPFARSDQPPSVSEGSFAAEEADQPPSTEEPPLPPSPSFGTLSDNPEGGNIENQPTPFDPLSEDDIQSEEAPEEESKPEYAPINREVPSLGTNEEEDSGSQRAEPVKETAQEEATEDDHEENIEVERPKKAEESVVISSPEEASERGFFGGIKSKIAAAKEMEAEKQETPGRKNKLFGKQKPSGSGPAGVDVSKPGLKESLRASRRSRQLKDKHPPSEFEKLLTPLSGTELSLLQQELEQEEPVFVQLRKARRQAGVRQLVGWLVGFTVLILFALTVGREYLLVTLTGTPIPNWVPLDGGVGSLSWTDLAGGILFGIGLVLPLVASFAVAESISILWRSLAFGKTLLLIEAIVAATAGIGIFILLINQQVILALGLAILWIVIRTIIVSILRRSG